MELAPMMKGLGRTPFGPRTTPAPATAPMGGETPPVAPVEAPPPAVVAPPAPPVAPRPREPVKEVDPAVEQYETLKRHIHMRLVDRLDMNRVSEMDPNTLRSEIRGVVEHARPAGPQLRVHRAELGAAHPVRRPAGRRADPVVRRARLGRFGRSVALNGGS